MVKVLVTSCNFLSNQCSFILDKNPPPNPLTLILGLTSSLLSTSGSYTSSLSIWLFPFFLLPHIHTHLHTIFLQFFFFSENLVILSSLKLLIILYYHQRCKYDFNLYWIILLIFLWKLRNLKINNFYLFKSSKILTQDTIILPLNISQKLLSRINVHEYIYNDVITTVFKQN